MIRFETILTHPGGAHADEFLACSVLLAVHSAPIVRREPTSDDLTRAAVCVVDVGHRHDPDLNNFDHHQLPKDHPPTCALSLVLQHLGLYDDARRFCDWLETAELLDTRGPVHTAKWLGISTDALTRLNSPVQAALLPSDVQISGARRDYFYPPIQWRDPDGSRASCLKEYRRNRARVRRQRITAAIGPSAEHAPSGVPTR